MLCIRKTEVYKRLFRWGMEPHEIAQALTRVSPTDDISESNVRRALLHSDRNYRDMVRDTSDQARKYADRMLHVLAEVSRALDAVSDPVSATEPSSVTTNATIGRRVPSGRISRSQERARKQRSRVGGGYTWNGRPVESVANEEQQQEVPSS